MQSVAVAHFCAIVYKWNIDEPEKKYSYLREMIFIH